MKRLTVDELHNRLAGTWIWSACEMVIHLLDSHGMVIVDKGKYDEYLSSKRASEDDLK